MRRKNFHILTVLAALLCTIVWPCTSSAQTYEGWVMVFQNANGETQELPMSEVGSLVAVDDALDFSILSSTGNVLAEKVLKVSFEPKSLTGINSIEKSGNIISQTVTDKLTLIGVSGEVAVYDAGGKLQMQVKANGGETVIGTSRLPKGIYVVKVGKQSFKFMKK